MDECYFLLWWKDHQRLDELEDVKVFQSTWIF